MSSKAFNWKSLSVWLARVAAGLVFVLSGWAKVVDPRGFALKIDEYLAAWGISDVVPDGLIGLLGSGVSIFELCIGILLVTGSLRRSAPICGLIMMAFWLPLTVYILIADPVSDCGCFGDFIILSNTVTFIKNIILTALLLVCLVWAKDVPPLFRPALQWIIPALTALYGIVLAIIGWHIQPVVDFRPYPVGASIAGSEDAAPAIYVYEKDGVTQEFSLDQLPDSTWEFIERIESPQKSASGISVFDGDEEISDELFGVDAPEQMVLLVYPHPGFDDLMRSRMANEIYDYAQDNDIEMIGLVAASDEAFEQWKDLARPRYDVYSADDTSLKQLVRGPIGIVYLRDGKVVWKRNFLALSPDFLSQEKPFDSVWIVDDGHVVIWLSVFFIAGLFLLYAISRLSYIGTRKQKKETENDPTDSTPA